MSTLLFTTEQVKKFFNYLDNQTRHNTSLYNDGKRDLCGREVFIRRSVNKWFEGKYIILYHVNENKIQRKKYVKIGSLLFNYGYSDAVVIYYIDVCEGGVHKMEIDHNKALRLEGIICENGDKHLEIMELFSIENLPEIEYKYDAWDWNKYQSRGRNTPEQKLAKIKTEVIFKAKTAFEAENKVKKLQKENPRLLIYI